MTSAKHRNIIAILPQLNSFIELLKERWGNDLVSAVLFGSYARREAKTESDIDLLIIKKSSKGEIR